MQGTSIGTRIAGRILGLVVCVGVCQTALAQGTATINKKKGDPHTEVEIIKVTFKAVHWAMAGGAKGEYAWDLIVSVDYGDSPTEYLSGDGAYNEGRYADAVPDLLKAAKNDSRKVWVFQESTFKAAMCYLRMGKNAEAAKTFADLNAADPEHKYLLESMLWLGRLSMAAGKYDDAEKQLAKLIEVANANEKKKQFYEARVWKARCFIFQGKLDAAENEFKSVADQSRGVDAKISAMALLGEAECLVAKKNLTSARDKFNTVIGKFETTSQDDDELDLLARAYNGLGETFYYQAAPDFKEAMRAFLKVVTLLEDQTDELPKALWHAAKCFHELRGEGKEWAQRSMDLRNQLRNDYPNSPWAKKW